MEKKKHMCVWCVILFTLLVVSPVYGEEWKQQDFIDLWNKVRTAIVENNLEEFKKLTVPTDTEAAEKMIQENFAEMVESFLIYSFPEWKSVKLVKFDQNDKKAILVLRLRLENEEMIVLAVYRFMLTESGWKMSAGFYDTTFSTGWTEEDNQQPIEEKLKEKPELQLEAE